MFLLFLIELGCACSNSTQWGKLEFYFTGMRSQNDSMLFGNVTSILQNMFMARRSPLPRFQIKNLRDYEKLFVLNVNFTSFLSEKSGMIISASWSLDCHNDYFKTKVYVRDSCGRPLAVELLFCRGYITESVILKATLTAMGANQRDFALYRNSHGSLRFPRSTNFHLHDKYCRGKNEQTDDLDLFVHHPLIRFNKDCLLKKCNIKDEKCMKICWREFHFHENLINSNFHENVSMPLNTISCHPQFLWKNGNDVLSNQPSLHISEATRILLLHSGWYQVTPSSSSNRKADKAVAVPGYNILIIVGFAVTLMFVVLLIVATVIYRKFH